MDFARNHVNRGYENDIEFNPKAVKRQTSKARRRVDKRLSTEEAPGELSGRRLVR